MMIAAPFAFVYNILTGSIGGSINEVVSFVSVLIVFRFYLTDTGKVIRRLRTSNKRRWKRRLKKFKEEYRVGNRSLEEITRSVVSYRGHLAHGHTWKLRKKVMGAFVLTHAPGNEPQETEQNSENPPAGIWL